MYITVYVYTAYKAITGRRVFCLVLQRMNKALLRMKKPAQGILL